MKRRQASADLPKITAARLDVAERQHDPSADMRSAPSRAHTRLKRGHGQRPCAKRADATQGTDSAGGFLDAHRLLRVALRSQEVGPGGLCKRMAVLREPPCWEREAIVARGRRRHPPTLSDSVDVQRHTHHCKLPYNWLIHSHARRALYRCPITRPPCNVVASRPAVTTSSTD